RPAVVAAERRHRVEKRLLAEKRLRLVVTAIAADAVFIEIKKWNCLGQHTPRAAPQPRDRAAVLFPRLVNPLPNRILRRRDQPRRGLVTSAKVAKILDLSIEPVRAKGIERSRGLAIAKPMRLDRRRIDDASISRCKVYNRESGELCLVPRHPDELFKNM